MRIGIVGAGMGGLSCAEGWMNRQHDVALFDKGRGPGGRMSTRRLATSAGEACFDHGAQYFTVRDAAFRRRFDAWSSQGAAAPWPSAGSETFVGVPAMNSPLRQMSEGQSVRWTSVVMRIESVGRGWRLVLDAGEAIDVDIAVVATPAEQAAALLASIAPHLAARALAAPSEPCWTTMLAFSEPVAVAEDCWRGRGIVGWAIRNSSKPGRTGPESWVVQAGPAWSKTHIEADPQRVTDTLKDAFSEQFGVALPAWLRPATAGASLAPARKDRAPYSSPSAALDSAVIG
jgi:renalase